MSPRYLLKVHQSLKSENALKITQAYNERKELPCMYRKNTSDLPQHTSVFDFANLRASISDKKNNDDMDDCGSPI